MSATGMSTLKSFSKRITSAKWFELSITLIILINSLLIGVETYVHNDVIASIQTVILGIFTFEILMRFIAAEGIKSFFKSGWNLFDLTLVLIGYIPETMFSKCIGNDGSESFTRFQSAAASSSVKRDKSYDYGTC